MPPISRAYELAFMACVFANVASIMAGTVPDLRSYEVWFNNLDIFFLSVFIFEYIWRVSTAAHINSDYAGWQGRLRYMRTPMAVLDLIAIVPALFLWSDATAIRALRLLGLFRILKLLRYQRAAQRLSTAILSRSEELVIVLTTLAIFIVLAAVAMYSAEHAAQPKVFTSILDGLWWAVITATTIGYGDIVPITPIGKFLAAICAFIGILLIALPTSIIAAAFMEHRPPKK
jgi:voltage-gated potassium channel